MRPRSILFACVGAAVAVAVYTVLAPNALPQLRADRRDNDALKGDVDKQRAENAALERDVAALKDEGPAGKAAVEKAARTDLGFVKKDEVLVTGLPTPEKAAQ